MSKALVWVKYHVKKFFGVATLSDRNTYINVMNGIPTVKVKIEQLKPSDLDGLYLKKKR